MEQKTKVCPKCKRNLPADTVHFYIDKRSKTGFSSYCKECKGVDFGKTNFIPRIKDNSPEGYYTCRQCKQVYPLINEHFTKNKNFKNGFYCYCKKCQSENNKNGIQKNKEHHAYIAHLKYLRIKNNPDVMGRRKEYTKKYSQTSKGKTTKKICEYRRRARKKKVINNFAVNDWQECLKYFNYEDAYTGLKMIVITQDHVVPIVKGGGHVKQNIVPCENNINSSKQDFDMETWYRKQPFFSEERLRKIYEWTGVKNGIQQIKII